MHVAAIDKAIGVRHFNQRQGLCVEFLVFGNNAIEVQHIGDNLINLFIA